MLRFSLVYIIFVLTVSDVFSQAHEDCLFCEAVRSGNFYSVEKQIKWEIYLRRHGDMVNNTYIVHNRQIAEFMQWLQSHPSVIEATTEKCTSHIAIYPGWIDIGMRLGTDYGIVEKAFTIQLGKVLRFNNYLRHIPCLFRHIPLSKEIMFLTRMYDSPGFCEQQKLNCKRMTEQDSVSRIEYLKALSLSTDTCYLRLKVIDNHPGTYRERYGTSTWHYLCSVENPRPDKGFNTNDILALSLNLSEENQKWLKEWTDPRPPMGWELIQPDHQYLFIINTQISPVLLPGSDIRHYYLYGGLNCVQLIPD